MLGAHSSRNSFDQIPKTKSIRSLDKRIGRGTKIYLSIAKDDRVVKIFGPLGLDKKMFFNYSENLSSFRRVQGSKRWWPASSWGKFFFAKRNFNQRRKT